MQIGIYKHFKGGLYRYICEAQLEWLPDKPQGTVVVYDSLDTGKVWVRSKDSFFGDVKIGSDVVKRFEYVDNGLPDEPR
jgi:hypothetical protein